MGGRGAVVEGRRTSIGGRGTIFGETSTGVSLSKVRKLFGTISGTIIALYLENK